MFCGTLKTGWMKCAAGYFSEISEKEAQELLDTKTEAYVEVPELEKGDVIYVLNRMAGEYEKCSFIETLSRTDGLYVRFDNKYGDMMEKASDYGTTWKTVL